MGNLYLVSHVGMRVHKLVVADSEQDAREFCVPHDPRWEDDSSVVIDILVANIPFDRGILATSYEEFLKPPKPF